MYENVIEKILLKDPQARQIFTGVYARDELPDKPKWPECFIVNTDPRSKPGTHWLAIHYNQEGRCIFFDSYGFQPSHFRLESYLNSTSSSWTWNRKRIQGDSDYCGLYCILFLLFSIRNKALSFINHFSDNYNNNDKFLKNLIEKYCKK